MRITNSKHVPWFFFVLLATLFACWLYAGNFYPERLSPGMQLPSALRQTPSDHRSVGGTPLGLWFGAISLAIFIFAALLSFRKKLPQWRMGAIQRWLRAHIWLTLLTIPLVILHSGFRFGGPMTTLLVVLYVIVMVSGIYGLILQHRLPRIMKEQVTAEAVFEQIPYIRSQLYAAAQRMRETFKPATAASAAKAVASRSIAAGAISVSAAPGRTVGSPVEQVDKPIAPILAADEAAEDVTFTTGVRDPASEAVLFEFLDRQVIPYLAARRGDQFRLSNMRYADETFDFVKLRVAEGYRARVEEMHDWCAERRLLDVQTRLQHWLHAWLFVHVPVSFLLLMLTIWHAFVTLFYY